MTTPVCRPSARADRIPLGPEEKLLLLAARTVLAPQEVGRLQSLLDRGVNWSRLEHLAATHAVEPLLFWQLQESGGDRVPAPARNHLHKQLRINAVRNLFLTGELLRLLDLFVARGITAIPFKGPTLAVAAYGNLALRCFDDLDLLVAPDDFTVARQVLLDEGYQCSLSLAESQQATYLQSLGQLPFAHPDGRRIVELHTTLAPRGLAFPLTHGYLMDHLTSVMLINRSVATLAPADNLLLLCMHGAKHRWESLGWICDLAEFLRRHPGLDWQHVQDVATRLRCQRLLRLGLVLAARLSVCVPGLRPDPVVSGLAAETWHTLFQHHSRPGVGLRSAWFHYRVRERRGDGLRYALSLAFEPTEADLGFCQLPARWSFVYYLLRPLRWGGQFVRRFEGIE